MIDYYHTGEWFLPGNNLRLPGRLRFDKANNKIELELFCNVYLDGTPIIKNDPERDKRYNSLNYADDFAESHILILGDARGKITLYHCQFSGRGELGKDAFHIKYTAIFAFLSVHILAEEKLQVKAAGLIFPYLSTWYDGYDCLKHLFMRLEQTEHINQIILVATCTFIFIKLKSCFKL